MFHTRLCVRIWPVGTLGQTPEAGRASDPEKAISALLLWTLGYQGASSVRTPCTETSPPSGPVPPELLESFAEKDTARHGTFTAVKVTSWDLGLLMDESIITTL